MLVSFLFFLEKERFKDNAKIAKSMLNDIEKQETWQSYTSLLFADFDII